MIEHIKAVWNEMSEEDKEYMIKAFSYIPAQFIAYKFYRKLGAPKWAAWGITTISTNVALSQDKYAFEQRKRERKVEQKQVADDIVNAVKNYQRNR